MSGECELCGECGFECKCTKQQKLAWFVERYKEQKQKKKEHLLAISRKGIKNTKEEK